MIYYHTGTGNTRACACLLANHIGEENIHRLTDASAPVPAQGERIIFMFPIYSWGVPPVVTDFINSLGSASLSKRSIYGICTCGDEAGVAMRKFSAQIEALSGVAPRGVWSVQMPNDYVLLPGFSVDSPEVEQRKLEAMPERISRIADIIKSGIGDTYDVEEGSLPCLRSMVFPLFKRWGVNSKRWHSGDACISCGKCVKACPVANIVLSYGRPSWGGNCISCCACFHVCPTRAIDYGSATKGKGQYFLS